MLQTDVQIDPSIAASLLRWHKMVEARDMATLQEIVAPDATFRSPTVMRPFESAEAVCLALSTVMTVFEEFTYHREFVCDDGRSVILEFSARVGDKNLKGVDVIRFNDDGRIIDFEVYIRPLNALQALYAAMTEKLGETLVAFKGRA